MCRLGRERGRVKGILTNSEGGIEAKRKKREKKRKEINFYDSLAFTCVTPTLQQFMPHHATTFYFSFFFGSGHRGSLDSPHFGTVHTSSPSSQNGESGTLWAKCLIRSLEGLGGG
ncbi:unnamed protein product [Tuber melanosporum]|uniref:(Perigord truffle) hypothetical protein n=1 Tax=Tuber melanosporum (strain Mel28) TaxID=656061 RepID=D5GIL0_TUBMM|nr:uncharacterized protein GSTUM_00008545001 [Tuber melanosporum]CAZ84353.1 unnamed protein product [Tuber melanosporum]